MTILEVRQQFLRDLGERLVSYSDPRHPPMQVVVRNPSEVTWNVYLYSVTNPPGGRPADEYKVQARLPEHKRQMTGEFSRSRGGIPLLVGLQPDYMVYVLWDATLHQRITYNRNFQVKRGTILEALTSDMSFQYSPLRSGIVETIIACTPSMLLGALDSRLPGTAPLP